MNEEQRFESVVERVVVELGDALDRAAVEERVRAAFASLADAPIQDFVPILAERTVLARVRDELGLRVDREGLRSIVA